MKMNSFALSLGSNTSAQQVAYAAEWLLWLVREFRGSALYETPALNGGTSRYTNAVVMGRTEFGYDDFNEMLKEYERDCGRDAAARAEGRVPVDIDIVIWNEEVKRPRDFRAQFFQIGYNELNP